MKRPLLLIFAAFMALSLTGQKSDHFERLIPPKKLDHYKDQRGISDIKKRLVMPYIMSPGQSPAPVLKSQHGLKMALDSIYIEHVDWVTGQLEYDTKNLFYYDDNGNLTREVVYFWDDGQWEMDWMEEYNFNAFGNLTELLYSVHDLATDEWIAVERETFSYDNAGNLAEIITSDWDEFDEEWVPLWKDEFTYDAAGNRISEIYYDYFADEDEWVAYWQNELTWDNNTLIFITSFEWDFDIEDWVEDYRLEFLITASANHAGFSGFEWDADTEKWIPDWTGGFFLDESGNIISEEYSEYSQDENEWEPYSKTEYQYDELGNRTEEIHYFMDSYPDWTPYEKLEYTVNHDYTSGEILSPFYFDMFYSFSIFYSSYMFYQFPNMLVEVRESIYDGDDWEDSERTVYYYSEIELDEPEVVVLMIEITGNGMVMVNGDEYLEPRPLSRGSEITLEAIGDTGYDFIGWTGDLESDEAVETFIIESDMNISATFSILNEAELLQSYGISVFPNPFSSSITISGGNIAGTVTITSLAGQRIREFRLSTYGNNTLDTGDMDNGIYLLIFNPDIGGRVVIKMIKN